MPCLWDKLYPSATAGDRPQPYLLRCRFRSRCGVCDEPTWWAFDDPATRTHGHACSEECHAVYITAYVGHDLDVMLALMERIPVPPWPFIDRSRRS